MRRGAKAASVASCLMLFLLCHNTLNPPTRRFAHCSMGDFQQTLHEFFRALRKGEYLVEWERGAGERVGIAGDEDVGRMFEEEEERWAGGGDEKGKRPTANVHIVPNPEFVRVEVR